MLRRNPTKIELRQEDKEEFEALKQHQAQQEASGARQEAGAARAPERSTLQQQPKAQLSVAARIGLQK